MNVVFAGTPEFAVASLDAIAQSRHALAFVVTQPDRPAGRRRKPTPPPVKRRAIKLGLPVFQASDVNSPDSVRKIAAASPKVLAVVAFGQILSPELLAVPPMGCVNVHASLLPELRGAAPINWAIVRGYRMTGVTTQLMAPKMDAGDILLQDETPIGENETAGELQDRLAPMGARLLVQTLDGLEDGTVTPTAQDHSHATFAPRLAKGDGRIDWSAGSRSIKNLVRGFNPWPSAYAFLRHSGGAHQRLVILEVVPRDHAKPTEEPGTVLSADEAGIRVATGSGAVDIVKLQRAGKRPMDAASFLCGSEIAPGDKLDGEG